MKATICGKNCKKSDDLFVCYDGNVYFCSRNQLETKEMIHQILLNGLIIIRLQGVVGSDEA